MTRGIAGAVVLSGLMCGGPAWAQNTATPPDARPAITSFWGDTGLWFVPTAEVTKPRGWAFGAYRTEQDFKQGSTDVSYYPATVAFGIDGRTEIFGALRAVTEIDRDTRPLFAPSGASVAGVVNEYPLAREGWTGHDLGDLYAGAKFNLLSEHRLQPLALAFRGTAKLPTAGIPVGTGQWDYFADLIASKELSRAVEVSGYGGYAFRGDPDDVSISDGMRWGVGAAFGSRSALRFTTELYGELPSDAGVVVASGALTGSDGSIAPAFTALESRVNAAAGLTWQHPSGLLLGVGTSYRFGVEGRSRLGLQLRLGFHSGVRIFAPPAPAPLAEAPPPAAAPPAVQAAQPAAPPRVPPVPPQPTETVTGQPVRSPVPALADVRFDVDQSTLRPDALTVLATALRVLNDAPALRLHIEGHASEEGTAEYNLALGERRARAVYDYLVSQGINPSRLTMVSYGEENPKYDNSQEATRSLNRRAELVPE